VDPVIDLRSRYRGCLLGLACGDALGGPVEFKSRTEIERAHPGGLREFIGGGWLSLAPGEVTDDTQMTIALACGLTGGGPLAMEDVAAEFLTWFRSQPKDVGNTTADAIRNLGRGMSWQQAGAAAFARNPARSAGNGAVMRCAPVALRFRRDRELLRSASIDTTRITHADTRCTESAVAVNRALARLLEGASTVEAVAAALVDIGDHELREAVAGAGDQRREDVRSGGYVVETTAAAFWALLNHANAEETIVAAVMLGQDADTTGAVSGALAGARYGVEGLPMRWLEQLAPRDELIALADRLLELSEAA
jgi:ADP-ribosyl-[dinitrogen reductase] hydrolase